MIRSMINESIKTNLRDAVSEPLSGLIETGYGSLDGTAPATSHEMTSAEFVANETANVSSTVAPIPSNAHSDGTTVSPA